MRKPLAIFTLTIGLLGCASQESETAAVAPEESETFLVFFGTGGKESEGIYGARFDTADGSLTPLGVVAEARSPGFVEIDPSGERLYSTGASAEGAATDWQGVASYSINRESGQLTLINGVGAEGRGTCHVTVDSQGHTVAVANYGSGSIASMSVAEDGTLSQAVSAHQHEGSSVNEERQKGPHAHSVNFSPDDRFLIAADLGTDEVIVYSHDPATSKIERHSVVKPAPGSGPRHFAFHPTGSYAYVINEMASTVTGYTWDAAAGELTEIQTIGTLPEDFTEFNKTAEIVVHPSGRFLYGSNRGHNSLAVFSVDPATGQLTFVEHVTEGIVWPRNFRIDPTGQYLISANRDTNNVVVFSIDQQTGRLTPTGHELAVPGPICVRFLS